VDAGLPPEVTAKLAKLQEGVTAMPWETIRGVIETELGPVEELFEHIDETPIAAASIGQVHRAVTRDGAQVVVKVRYPGVDSSMNADFAMMNTMAKLAGLFSAVDGKALVEELRERVLEECDYAREATSQRRFAGLLQTDADIVVPAVLASYCSASVLTTEFIDGQRFGAFIAEATDQARSRAATALFRLNFGPLLRDGVLHADPHPGNQLYLEGGRIAALDFGCIRAFKPAFVTLFLRFVDGIVADDRTEFAALAEALGLAPRPEKIDFDAMWGQYRWMFEPLWREGFRFTRQWWLEGRQYTKPTAPNARHQGMPPEWIWLQRVVWGLWAVLLKLDGVADFRSQWLQLRSGREHAETLYA
jgi:predicted unusual protein kinase regulating ubiquinone biosynthesis (AarF/ABC1/UbiB family)